MWPPVRAKSLARHWPAPATSKLSSSNATERLSAVPDSNKPRILILGGTAEAAALALSLDAGYGDRWEVTTSLAGRTRTPAVLPGQVRSGGFGGAAALAEYLKGQKIAAVIDATHPFAAQISANAVTACEIAAVPRLVLSRPGWSPQSGDNWIEFETVEAAAEALPRFGQRAFLTIGVQELGAFAGLTDTWFLVRLIDTPPTPLPLTECQIVTGRGPFSEDGERALMEDHRIDVLVSKASGGDATAAKLAAARYLGLPALMVRRPPAPQGPTVTDVSAAVDWVLRRLDT
jgi:precorrin-6A/cobalt-precorrin-6A reductase